MNWLKPGLAPTISPIGLFAGIGDDFTGDALHLAHAQSRRHHFGAGTHDTAHGEHAAAGINTLLGLQERSRPGQAVDEGLHLVGGTFLAQEVEDDADRFFRDNRIDANVGDETRDQFVHIPLTPRTGGGLSLY